jgi:drug/metabolite transporter (DMT)-like permease
LGFALLALLGAAFWGIGDFLGGVTSRRAHVLTVLAVSQAVGLVGVAVWTIASGDSRPALEDLWPAAGAGAAGAVGLASLYRGMAVGAMGIVAPISAASPIIPLAVDLGRGTSPSATQWCGIAAVLGGIMLLAREPGSSPTSGVAAGVALALVAAVGFGLFVVGLDAASEESVPWTILVVRATSTLLAVGAALAASASLRPPTALVPAIVTVGAFDTAANALVALATTRGPAGVVAVLSALYPVTTVVLARALLAERLDRARRAGGVLALGGAAAVAVG